MVTDICTGSHPLPIAMDERNGAPDCNCEYSKKFRVTEWGDIVPADISDEELEALRKARGSP